MKKIIFSILTVLSFISMNAQEIPAKEALQGNVSQEVAALRLATELVKYGYAQQSALPLIDALQIISEIPIQALDASKVGEAVIDSVAVEKKSKISFNYQSILAGAKKFADGDDNLLAIIDNIDAEAKGATRGNVNGPSRDYAAVYANSYMPISALSPYFSASSSTRGPSLRHGPHQGAQQSITTTLPDSIASLAEASVNSFAIVVLFLY